MSRSGYTWMFWGFLFLLVNFYVQGLNVLPDVVGYILLAVGASTLRTLNPRFHTVFILSFPLMVLSLPNLHQVVQPNGIHAGPTSGNPLIWVMGTLVWILMFFVVFNVCKGTAEVAITQFQPHLAEQAMVRWNLFLVLQIATGFVRVLAWLHATPLVIVLGTLLILYAMVVTILFMLWLWQCRETL